MKDIRNNFDVVNSIDPDDYTTDENGVGVDLRKFDGSAAVFCVGTITDGTHTPKVQESDDNSTWNDVSPFDLEGPLVDLVSDTNQRVGYKGNKRYLRTVLNITGATIGAKVAAMVVRAIPHQAPVN